MREKTIYEKIAEKYNTTPEEVRREMQIAIDAGFDDPDPVVQAEKNGKSESIRYSETFAKKTFYYAVKLDDGNVLRVTKGTRLLEYSFSFKKFSRSILGSMMRRASKT